MMRAAFGAAVCTIIVAATIQVSAQPKVPAGPFEVDPIAATSHYAEMFERTCYRHRHTLDSLVTERPSPEFEKVPRTYPLRDETQKLTVLAEWGVWSHGLPYTILLTESDAEPGIFICSLVSPFVDKKNIVSNMLAIKGLSLFKEITDGDNDIAAFKHETESRLRVLCRSPKNERLYNIQCSLWSWPATGS